MNTSKSPNPWHGLLFLQGHIADAELARALARAPAPAPPRSAPGGVWSVLEHVLYLGGRPMHAGRNFDLEEPFEGVPVAQGVEVAARGSCSPERATC